MTCVIPHPQSYVPELKTLATNSITSLLKKNCKNTSNESSNCSNEYLMFSAIPGFDCSSIMNESVKNLYEHGDVVGIKSGPYTQEQKSVGSSALPLSMQCMKYEANRLKSFQNRWPLSYIKSSDLASVGLFYLGIGDRVQCAFCQGVISDWEEGDKPLQEHIYHFPMCPFLMNRDVGNIPISGLNGSQQWQIHRSLPESTLPVRSHSYDSGTSVTNFKPKHPAMGSFDKRLETFKNWPPSAVLIPGKLAESGLFYSGVSDVVTCFCCGGSLGNWDLNDDAWTEHAKHFPECVYVKCIKGSGFPQSIRLPSESVTMYQQTVEQASASKFCQQSSAALEKEVSINAENISQENIAATENGNSGPSCEQTVYTCKICMDEDTRVAFLPCGHSLACPRCASNLTTCPVCRRKIESTIRIYFD